MVPKNAFWSQKMPFGVKFHVYRGGGSAPGGRVAKMAIMGWGLNVLMAWYVVCSTLEWRERAVAYKICPPPPGIQPASSLFLTRTPSPPSRSAGRWLDGRGSPKTWEGVPDPLAWQVGVVHPPSSPEVGESSALFIFLLSKESRPQHKMH